MTHPDIETVARAMCCPKGCVMGDQKALCVAVNGSEANDLVEKAQAAITVIFDAIAEPTPAMCVAGAKSDFIEWESPVSAYQTEMGNAWSAMLRAKRLEMLGEGK